MDLSGSAVLVTGGAKRVGRAIVIELAQAGCNVAIHYHRSRSEAEDAAAAVSAMGRRVVTVEGDLRDSNSWGRIVEEAVGALGGLDILVNNASVFLAGQTDVDEPGDRGDQGRFDHAFWESMLRVNLVAPAALCHYAGRYLAARGRGCVVNLCDIAADRPWPDHLAYSASKAALTALTKGLARALAPAIRVNGVAPGIAVFPDEYSPELRRCLTNRVPLERAGTPEEVAGLVRFLVESGEYVTGQVIPIDGGRSIA